MKSSNIPESTISPPTSVTQNGYTSPGDIPAWEALTPEQQQIVVNLYEQEEALSNGYICPGYESFNYGFSSDGPSSTQIYLPPPQFLNQFTIPQPQFQPPIQQPIQPEQPQQATQREVQPGTQQTSSPNLNEGDRPYADTPSAVQIWYYTGRVSDQLQIAYGRVPPSDITPWGLSQFAEMKAMAMTNRVEKLVEGRKASLEGRGIQLSEEGEKGLYQGAAASVWEQVKAVDRERLENWQQGKDCTRYSDFFGESAKKGQSRTDPALASKTSARAKLEQNREQHGKAESTQKNKGREIER